MRACLLIVPLGLLCGCASTADKRLVDLRQRLDELAQNEAANQRRLEDMNNRLFLLEDKVDTTRVAAQRASGELRLPVIRIRPQEAQADDSEARAEAPPAEPAAPGDAASDAADEDDVPTPGPGDGRRSLVDASDVKYGGDASQAGPRPVLRLHGGRPTARAETPDVARRAMESEVQALGEDAKLGVVPIGKKGAASAAKGALALYSQAMEQYRAGRYGPAATAFKRFVGRYAKHAYTDNAMYWLAECFYDQKDYRAALGMFRRVVEDHPHGNKAPDALLKMGYCYLKLREKQNARSVLAQVVEIFPKTNSAQLASDALAKLQ